VRNWPLAVCDSNTIAPSKLVETDQVREAYAGVSLYAMYDEAMKWYFMNKQNDDEVLLLKMFDSADVPARSGYKITTIRRQELTCNRLPAFGFLTI
jgi:hypothetical protein